MLHANRHADQALATELYRASGDRTHIDQSLLAPGGRGDIHRIGHVDVEVSTQAGAIERIGNAVRSRKRGVWGFCNAHTVNVARKVPAFRRALAQMTLFNDGIGLEIASKIIHRRGFLENVNGTDLTPNLLRSLAYPTPIFLIGSLPGVAEVAKAALEQAYPNIQVVGVQHGFFAAQENEAIVRRIQESGARLILVGMGHPRQEFWAVENMEAIHAPLLCVGAFLDFSAGKVSRAPDFVRRLRCEWLYRLAIEPRRLANRYLVGNVTFLAAALGQRLSRS